MGKVLYCCSQLENIDHLFWQYLCITDVWNNLEGICLNPINSSMHFLYWIEWLWKNRNVYNKLYHYPLKKTFGIHGLFERVEKVIFNKGEVKLAFIINLAVNCINELRYCNFMASLFDQDFSSGNRTKLMMKRHTRINWIPSPEGYIKVNVDASKRHATGSTTIGFIGEDNRGVTVMQEGF